MIRAVTVLFQRYSHVNWALADQAMLSGVNFFTGILLARYLGIEEFGRFTVIWMAVLFFNSIHSAVIISPMMSIGPKQPDGDAPAYYGAVIIHQIVFSCVSFFLLFVGARWSVLVFPEWGLQGLALPLATAAVAFLSQGFLRRYFFTRGRMTTAFVNDAICYLGQIVILVWLFMFSRETMDTVKILWVIAIMAAFATVCGAFFFERIEINRATQIAITSRHWHFSKWLTGSALMQWTTGNLFIMVAGGLLGASAVGALKAAQNLMGVVHILFMGLENVVPVRAARHFHIRGKKALCDYLKRVALFGGGATVAISVVAAIAPDFWLGLAFGEQYIGYGNLLRGWAAIYLLIFLRLPLTSGLRALERPQTIFAAYLWTTLFSVFAAYPMTVHLGLYGVLGGIATIQLFQLSILWFGLKKRLI